MVFCAGISLLVAVFQFQRQVTTSVLNVIAEELADEQTVRKVFASKLLTQETIDILLADDGKRAKVALASEQPEERLAAVIILGEAGPRAASCVQILIDLLNDINPEIRRHATYALGEVGPNGAPALEPLYRMAVSEHERVRPEAAKAIAKILDEADGAN